MKRWIKSFVHFFKHEVDTLCNIGDYRELSAHLTIAVGAAFRHI